MQKIKRVISLCLVVVLMLSTLAIPASATSLSFWQARFSALPQLHRGSSETLVIKALQRFLYIYPSTRSTIINAGGIDGSYGTGTYNAVKTLQGIECGGNSADVDGIVGSRTWSAIPKYLQINPNVNLLSYASTYDMYFVDLLFHKIYYFAWSNIFFCKTSSIYSKKSNSRRQT